jgi:urease accessory protein
MVAVGLWAVLAGDRAIWAWPIAFLATMLLGFAAASLGLELPLVEPAILSSIIIVGMLVAFAVKAPLWLGAVIVGLFAFFHGHAHGTEVAAAHLVPYATGFTTATAGLLAGGVALGLFVERSIGRRALRATGMVTVLGGLTLLVS